MLCVGLGAKSFLAGGERGRDEIAAFLQYNSSPSLLGLRKDIAMLELLFRVAKRMAHVEFSQAFPLDVGTERRHTRSNAMRHSL